MLGVIDVSRMALACGRIQTCDFGFIRRFEVPHGRYFA